MRRMYPCTLSQLGSGCFLHIALNIFPFLWKTWQKLPWQLHWREGQILTEYRGGNIFHKQSHSGFQLIPLALKNETTNYTRGCFQKFWHAINPLNIETDKLSNKFCLYFTYGLWSCCWIFQNNNVVKIEHQHRHPPGQTKSRIYRYEWSSHVSLHFLACLRVVVRGGAAWMLSLEEAYNDMSARAVKRVVLSIHLTTLLFIFDPFDTKAK